MDKLGSKYGRIDDLLNGLRQTVIDLQNEVAHGRGNDAWLLAEKNKASMKVQDKIKEILGEVGTELIKRRAEGNDLVQPDPRYDGRTYHMQNATAISQGKNAEQLAATLKGLSREQLEFKDEYIRIFSGKIDGNDEGWQEAVKSMRTPEEREQQAIFKEIAEFKSFIPTIDAHIERSLVRSMDGEVSEHTVKVLDLFNDCKQTVKQRVAEEE